MGKKSPLKPTTHGVSQTPGVQKPDTFKPKDDKEPHVIAPAEKSMPKK